MKNTNWVLKNNLKKLKDELSQEFSKKTNIVNLTNKLVIGIDELIIPLFQKHLFDQENQFCLIALGSYGRRELQLYSDVDLLLLHTESVEERQLLKAQQFIQDCWDIGLEISHQITTVDECAKLASQDVSVISSILDMRLLCGRRSFIEALFYQTHPLHIWTSHDYFFAKEKEQQIRYEKYGETAYNLEPNVKNGAGGLRDIQVLFNICKRHFGIKKLSDGIGFGFITPKEYEELIYCQHFLWRVRFALHILADKKEDRLLFDYQSKLAKLFGYSDTEHSLAIEQFMKAYFKVIKRSRELNEMLLQWFSETIVYHQKQTLTPLDDWFQLSNQYIEVKHSKVFSNRPQALLEIFLWLANHPEIEGVRANTIRLIRQHLYLIDKAFCKNKEVTKTFLAILSSNYSPFDALQRMSRYGVLGYYLEPFGVVTGQMQYDLFHVYTVDQHTLFVIRNLGRFNNSEYSVHFKLAHQLFNTIENKTILYLAALFHDIAKGRGGDHSDLGAIEAQHFAKRHRLNKPMTDLFVWLVQNHLLMSQTAQRQDIYDPRTIATFCNQLPKAHYLDYLYLLTVADICATNPNLWNAWKDSLLKELYYASKNAMTTEKKLLDEHVLIEQRRSKALTILKNEGLKEEAVLNLWRNFKGKYFLHESSKVIAQHTKGILTSKQFPLIMIMPHHSQGGTEVFIYMPHCDERFTITTTTLNNHQATIQEATILTCDNQFDLDTYIILDERNQAILDEQRISEIKNDLQNNLTDHARLPAISSRRLSRIQAHFKIKPEINFNEDKERRLTQLFIITGDRPGLLAHISQLFLKENIHLHSAKIATAGERVEDMFHISNYKGESLCIEEQAILKKKLMNVLTKI
ncbi:[protein-PII] uridylyltransferase [Legionella impletisoli]|uniref:Bifunctional uridylyltransferase/uridylyl-removing enzyme n=1 Tax=Legionella impletisoli TaxID=343510 RepID=A0A917N8B4_9GAMM|nr:[protein-PII] uridylyltransferase [Legionella impletisoli]GGI75701.1 bifunctional uridylyltransferase/uridylyl-removing enzyme [Legionella impletisoli]